MVLEGLFNLLFGWAVDISPLFGIIVVSIVMSIISTVSWKYLTDQTLLKDLRLKTKKMSAEVKKYKNDPKKLAQMNAKMAKENMQMMKTQYKQTIKPMIVTLVPFFLVYVWIRNTYEPFGDIFLSMGGIWTYIVFSVVLSMVLRKVMKVY